MKLPIIELKDVYKTYKMGEVDVNAVCGINIKIYRGDFLAIMGPSGSGKSTLMNLIGCLDLPSKGSIFLEGKDVSKMSESDLANIRGRKIGFIFQQFNLLSAFNALENVMLPMMFQNISKEEQLKRGRELLELLGMLKRMEHKPSELSGGEQQRIAIARALANSPEILLADEPTGNLDSKTGEEILSIIRDLNMKEKKTIILITHDINIARYAQKIIFIEDGKIKSHDSKKDYEANRKANL